ncbi:hypothetical protein [Microbacterium sp. H1-D42]|uniref:glycosyl hydrolase family 95 catalytic domain-containing protein n=1 Tax=Microbacterium sp. H1-D42 TaxID=2925844 RepID=UPI001F537A9E|nr:hypothetical protein [Microbacterium sp. H1-D42]UNK70461.1 hypothetical protein MNR00_15080 [Microbacterium sp. H1-D42]
MTTSHRLRRAGAVVLAACMGVGALTAAALPAAANAAPESTSTTADWDRIQEIIAGIYGEWTGDGYQGAIANGMPNTALLGNGDLGVTSYGAAGEKTFLLSKSDFISAGNLRGSFGSGDNTTKPLPIGGVTIREAQEDASEQPTNLAPGYSAVRASGQHDAFAPALAVSGTFTPSPNGYGWVTPVGKTHWLEVSFPQPITVQSWLLRNDGAVRAGYSQNNTSDFALQVSETGGANATWTDVAAVTGNKADVFEQNLEAPVTSSHFRLLVTAPLQASNSDPNPRARIGQLELFEQPRELTEPPTGEGVVTKEKQDILNAQVDTEMAIGGVPVSMESWLAPNENVMVTEVTSKGTDPVNLEVATWGKKGNVNYPATSAVEDGIALATRSTFNNAPLNEKSWTSRAALATSVLGAEAEAAADGSGEATTSFLLEPGASVKIVTAVGGGGQTLAHDGELNGAEPATEALALLDDAATPASVKALDEERANWWKEYWTASYVDLPNRPEVMRYYYGAQYLLGSTSREGELAPGLFGVWHTTDTPSWSSDYHLNYNFIATFYGANSSNRPEFTLPAVDAMLGFVDEGKRRAADVDQLRRINAGYVDGRPDLQGGIEDALLFPVGIGPWGMVTDDTYLSEALNASYSAYPLIQYFHYTQDEKYLDEKVYDYLVSAVNFYDAWIDKSAKPYTLFAGYNEGSWAQNPAVELAAFKNVLDELIHASELLDRDADRRPGWKDLRDNLAAQPTSTWKDKQVYSLAEQEWRGGKWVPLANPVPGDGNIIPLDIVVPGGQLGYYSTDAEQQIARNTIDVFGTGAWRQINNFPRIFNDAVQNRYPAEDVLSNLTTTINAQLAPNLRINDGNHGVEKIGATAAINNMLLITDQGVTKVFPNWVKGEDASFGRLLAEGGFEFTAAYDGASDRIGDVTVTSKVGKSLTLASPWAEGADVFDSKGVQVTTNAGTAPNWETEKTISFATEKGETYKVKPRTSEPKVLKASASSNGNFAMVDFSIRSANGKGYTMYTSKSGAPGTFKAASSAKFNKHGARLDGFTGDLFAYLVYRDGGRILDVTEVVKLTR